MKTLSGIKRFLSLNTEITHALSITIHTALVSPVSCNHTVLTLFGCMFAMLHVAIQLWMMYVLVFSARRGALLIVWSCYLTKDVI